MGGRGYSIPDLATVIYVQLDMNTRTAPIYTQSANEITGQRTEENSHGGKF